MHGFRTRSRHRACPRGGRSQGAAEILAASLEVLKQADLSLDDVDLVIPHQANARIIDGVCKRLSRPPELIRF